MIYPKEELDAILATVEPREIVLTTAERARKLAYALRYRRKITNSPVEIRTANRIITIVPRQDLSSC